MKQQLRSGPSGWRIILSIYVKDLIDAVRNWATLTVIVGTALVLLTAQAGSIIAGLVDQEIVVAFDQGRSSLLREMRRLETPRVIPVDSIEELELAVGDAPDVRIGVIIPAGVDSRLGPGGAVQLDVMRAHWADVEEAQTLIDGLDRQLNTVVDADVDFKLLDQYAYPQLERGGRSLMVTSALVIGVLTVGTFLTPYLLAEEKEDGTLAVLRLSPATEAQIVLAKALVGLTCCLIVGFTALIFNWYFVVHPLLSFLSIILLGFFAVLLGLLIGMIAKQMSTINLWMAVALLILIAPTITLFMDSSSLPHWVNLLMDWIPTVSAGRLIRISFLEKIEFKMLIQPFAAISAFIVLTFAVVVHQLRKEDRI
jgi:ABC-type Na+ efflux pump permease subunit